MRGGAERMNDERGTMNRIQAIIHRSALIVSFPSPLPSPLSTWAREKDSPKVSRTLGWPLSRLSRDSTTYENMKGDAMSRVEGNAVESAWSTIGLWICLVLLPVTHMAMAAEPAAAPAAQTTFAAAQARLAEMRKQVADKPAIAQDSYVRLGLAVVERFPAPVPGGPAGMEADWSRLQSDELDQVLTWTEQRIAALVSGAKPVIVLRPVGGPIVVRDGLLIASTRVGDSPEVTHRPYWFGGYMNYAASANNTATAMLPQWRDLGATMHSIAPSLAFVEPGWKPGQNLKDLPQVLRTAAENGVMLDLAVSPHVMPEWAIKDAPDVMSTTPATFIAYNIDHPRARQVIERWLRMLVPVVKDSPGLFGFYLSNEPEYLHSGRDRYSLPAWIKWLKVRHGTIGALNTLYKTDYKSFDQVPVPPVKMPDEIEAKRAYYDWATFNHQHFADWHGWMNGIIKSIEPRALTHVKALRILDMGTDAGWVASLPDPELLSDVTALADSDAWPCLPAHEGPDAYWWRSQALNYDLLHSFRGQPVCDSENHPINVPADPKPVPAAQTRAAVWQAALHHRAAAALFVWENWTTSDCQGQIYFRPANIYAAGRAMLDTNRLGEQLAAISLAKPKVALLYSVPATCWERDYSKTLRSVYTALTFMGQPITFISERQLATGNLSSANDEVDWIILPRATHVRDATVAGLEKFVRHGGHVIMVGQDCLGWDEYHRPRTLPKSLSGVTRIEAAADEHAMMEALKPVMASAGLGVKQLTELASGADAWSVEYRIVSSKQDLLIPMISYNDKPMTVKLDVTGKAVDLLGGEDVDLTRITLVPMQPLLLRVQQ